MDAQWNRITTMQKLFIPIILTVVLSLGCSHPTFAKDKTPGIPLVCDTVLQAPNLTAAQIYDNLKVWFANNMRSSNNVIQLDDAENKHIIGKANVPFKVNHFTWSNLTGVIRFTIDVAARDGRYRVKLSDFSHESFSNGWTEGPILVNGPNPEVKGLRKKQNSEMQKRALPVCLDAIASIIVTLQELMTGNAPSVTDEEW